MPRTEPRFHAIVTEPCPGWPGGMRVVLMEGGERMESLVTFMMSSAPMNRQAQALLASAVGRLYDYLIAAPPVPGRDDVEFMQRFAAAVIHGTIRNGDDPLDLYWPGSSKRRARQILRAVNAFSDYCAKLVGARPLNPPRNATFVDRIRAYQALAHRKKYDPLAHLATSREQYRRALTSQAVQVPRNNKVLLVNPPFFPFERTHDLLYTGFKRATSGPFHEQYALRDMMIVILQRYGGIRASEAMHIFVDDVEHRPVQTLAGASVTADVWLYHPEDGLTSYTDPITKKRSLRRRADVLQALYQRDARNSPRWPVSQWVGWKDLLIEEAKRQRSLVHFFPEEWAVVFYRLYCLYVARVRPRNLGHPYLFVSGERGDGSPLTLGSYHDSVARAVRRIGLESSKSKGTTSHGFRHAYGQVLSRLNVNEKVIQVLMHHKSPLSQQTYTQMPLSAFTAAINGARQQLATGASAVPHLTVANLIPPPGIVIP